MAKITEKEERIQEKTVTLVYVGPTLPGGRLKSNSVFNGTEEGIKKHLSSIIEKYPQVARLLVPTTELGSVKGKVNMPGNIMNKYCDDILMSIKTEEMEG